MLHIPHSPYDLQLHHGLSGKSRKSENEKGIFLIGKLYICMSKACVKLKCDMDT